MKTYSHTKITTFEECPLRFKYRYIDKIKGEYEGIEAFMGKRVHETLEYLYTLARAGREINLEDLFEFYKKDWEKNLHKHIVIVHPHYEQRDYFKIGEECIKSYFDSYKPFNQNKVVGMEKEVRLKLNENYEFMGIIDRLDCTDRGGKYEIHDYKTSMFLPPKDMIEKSLQLPLYQLAVEAMYDDAKNVELIWHYLYYNKEIRIVKRKEQIEHLREEIIGKIESIEKKINEGKLEPSKSALCDWCEYRDNCPLWKHLVKIERMEMNEFLKETGVALVNEYANLKREMEVLDRKEEKLKEALVKYAERENINNIFGSDMKIIVKKYPRIELPSEEARMKELEGILKEGGSWMALSTLNWKLLSNVVLNNQLDKELMEKIKPYIKRGETVWMRLFELSDGERQGD